MCCSFFISHFQFFVPRCFIPYISPPCFSLGCLSKSCFCFTFIDTLFPSSNFHSRKCIFPSCLILPHFLFFLHLSTFSFLCLFHFYPFFLFWNKTNCQLPIANSSFLLKIISWILVSFFNFTYFSKRSSPFDVCSISCIHSSLSFWEGFFMNIY